jgi:hypothetical protein
MTTATLTPQADQTPAVVKVKKELSGGVWVGRFPASARTSTLTASFKESVDLFMEAIWAADGDVEIANTYRPKQRAYLMHWAHKIFRNDFDPTKVPSMPGVEIEWAHPKLAESVAAAEKMVELFKIGDLAADTAPALHSLHESGQAVDMRIWWTGDLEISNKDGTVVIIKTSPRTGMNRELKAVGRTYGVIKFIGGAHDRPHWSTTGH